MKPLASLHVLMLLFSFCSTQTFLQNPFPTISCPEMPSGSGREPVTEMVKYFGEVESYEVMEGRE
jgi:hypothetical protein